MIEKLNTELFGSFCNFSDTLNRCRKAVCSGSAFLGEIRNRNKPTADCRIVRKNLFGVCKHIVIRNMGSYGDYSDFCTEGFDFFGVFAEKTRKFNAVIAKLFHLFDCAVKIALHFVSDGIELNCYGKLQVNHPLQFFLFYIVSYLMP